MAFDRGAYLTLLADAYIWRTHTDAAAGPELFVSSREALQDPVFTQQLVEHVLAFCADNGLQFDVVRQAYRVKKGESLVKSLNDLVGGSIVPPKKGQRMLLVDPLVTSGDEMIEKVIRYTSLGARVIPLALVDVASSLHYSSVYWQVRARSVQYHPMAFAPDVVAYAVAARERRAASSV